MEKESCLYQRTKTYLPLKILQMIGRGNCQNCTYDPKNNKNCSSYYPITKFKITIIKPSIENKL